MKKTILTMNNYIEETSKVSIEEACVNFGCIKEEVIDLEIEENSNQKRYGIILKNGESSNTNNLGNVTDPLDNNIIMETEYTKFEEVYIKEENRNCDHFVCRICNGNYNGYCIKCSSLSHILNNTVPLANSKSVLNTIPKDILEIRDISVRKGVFLLKTVAKNVVFGPFEGIQSINIAEEHSWLICDKKLVNIQNGNWMKDVCVMYALLKNVDIFQFGGNLYFQTTRKIVEGEELLAYYNEEEIKTQSNSKNCYFIPQKREELCKIFACTLCCLGFSSDICLAEHKSKCPHTGSSRNVEDFEFMECHCCKIWLEKQEYQEHHVNYCWEEYHRTSGDLPKSSSNCEISVEGMEEAEMDVKIEFETDKSSENWNLQDQLNKKDDTMENPHVKCSKTDDCEDYLLIHIELEQKDETGKRMYQTECTSDIDKQTKADNVVSYSRHHQCNMCEKKYLRKEHLSRHLILHGVVDVKTFKCTDCSFETTLAGKLKRHISAVHDLIVYKCEICLNEYRSEQTLRRHMVFKHRNHKGRFKCSECDFHTNHRLKLHNHLTAHDTPTPFECDVCTIKFPKETNLKAHMKYVHSQNITTGTYNCSKCPFQSFYKHSLKLHLNIHSDIKPFQCHICSTNFSSKQSLKMHIQKLHSKVNDD